MNSLSFKLVEIHDTDDDDVVGGQDLPYLVTASYEGSYQTAVDMIHADKSLDAFNVQPAQSRCKLPFHIEFCTFDSRAIHTFFGVPRPLSPEQELADRYWRSAYARTVGELRAALADLPDEFPLIHSGYDSDLKGNKNRLGVHVNTGEWKWTTPDCPDYSRHPRWALRITSFDPCIWKQIEAGAWRDKRYSDIK
ncbi:hypothetical protein [Burkholderia sp. AU4i]|jgi:hypothetical protein|uniref:hypothetical protein n=1 Tax=Burkholderia sp. AU4i TaxID=1335308 RepID=UPI0009DE44DE|nr:hypothetical protein [Burkholderia sp. AU4i]